MPYNPHIHHRRSIRLKGYDYSQEGLYFITICCNRWGNPLRLPFGNIQNDEMKLNEYGKIAFDEWAKLPERFPNMELDVFQIMPNHMHGIIALVGATPAVAKNNSMDKTVGAGFTPAPPAQNVLDVQNVLDAQNVSDFRVTARVAPTTIGDIIGAYKSLVANGCLEIYKAKNEMMGKLWQRNYYEHIIRNDESYHRISDYIINNPAKWNGDKFYTK